MEKLIVFTEITKEFERISNKGWIKGINNNTNSVGLTFEKELGKTTDSLIFPDYHGIEIKRTARGVRLYSVLIEPSWN